MESAQLKKLAVTSSMVAILALAFVPFAMADPINPNLNWAPNPTTVGGTTTATFGVNDVTPSGGSDADCPSGATFTGTLTVTTPGGGVGTYSVTTPTPCGTTNLTAVYPTAFSGTANTLTCGTYTALWSGTTSVPATFALGDSFTVTCPSSVPQFTAPAVMVAAIGLLLLVAVRKGRLLKIGNVPAKVA